jgi:hypothetical protein
VARFRKDIPQDLKFIWTILTSSTKSGCEGSEADVGVASAAASRDRLGECRSRSFKAGDRQVEFAIELRQVLKLDRQQVSIPAGILGQLVVGHDVGAFLGLRHGRQAKRGTRSMPSSPPPRCGSGAMTLPSRSIKTGSMKPNVRILSAIWRICLAE